MRLQLITGVVALLATPTLAHADGRFATWLSVYSDDDRLTVVSPHVSARSDVQEDVELSAAYDVDVITAASIDVTTTASPRGYAEERHGLRLGAGWRPQPATRLSFAYTPSWEPDYRSHAFSLQLAREWIDRRLTTRVDARLALDRVGRAGDAESRWHDKTTPALALATSWIFDTRTIGEFTYELQLPRGFMSSPYRFVAIDWTEGGGSMAVPEAVPDTRTRHAVAAGVRRAFAENWYGWLAYRFYVDDWGVISHTGNLEAVRSFADDKLLAAFSTRVYRQSGASFQQERYQASTGMLPVYRSADKMLSPNWSVLVGARLELSHKPRSMVEALRGVLKVELYDQHFSRFAFLKRRRALVISAGASVEY